MNGDQIISTWNRPQYGGIDKYASIFYSFLLSVTFWPSFALFFWGTIWVWCPLDANLSLMGFASVRSALGSVCTRFARILKQMCTDIEVMFTNPKVDRTDAEPRWMSDPNCSLSFVLCNEDRFFYWFSDECIWSIFPWHWSKSVFLITHLRDLLRMKKQLIIHCEMGRK